MSYNPLLNKGDGVEDDSGERSSFESHMRAPLCPSCQRRGRIRRYLSVIVIPLLLFIIAVLLAGNLSQTYFVKSAVATQAQDVTHRVYGNDRNYMSLDHKFDHLWDPDAAGEGAVMVELYPGGPKKIGLIGMFHQLHCLAGFRKAMQKAKEGQNIGTDDRDNPHWPHCFYHMRQSILCAADSTIERQRFRNGSIGSEFINGQWDVRTCGNPDKLYELRDSHKAPEMEKEV